MEIVSQYLSAKSYVISMGFGEEINWQKKISFRQLTESDFIGELVWVILSSGMRESVIRKLFPKISKAFFDFKSALLITNNHEQCRSKALKIFNHEKKISSIIFIIKEVAKQGFESFINSIKQDGINFLLKYPYLGPATSFHLAKNIGFDVVKPDRHLLRVADSAGFDSPNQLCEFIAEKVGDPISVVDIVIWRYATLNSNYLNFFR